MNDEKRPPIFGGRFLLPGRPQRRNALPECLRFLGEKPPGKTLRRFQVHAAPRRDQRRQARSPGRERLVRSGEFGEHREILTGTEPVAQALRFLRPDSYKPRPERKLVMVCWSCVPGFQPALTR